MILKHENNALRTFALQTGALLWNFVGEKLWKILKIRSRCDQQVKNDLICKKKSPKDAVVVQFCLKSVQIEKKKPKINAHNKSWTIFALILVIQNTLGGQTLEKINSFRTRIFPGRNISGK